MYFVCTYFNVILVLRKIYNKRSFVEGMAEWLVQFENSGGGRKFSGNRAQFPLLKSVSYAYGLTKKKNYLLGQS